MSDSTLALAEGVLSGQRHLLAKAITLVESLRDDHQEQANLLLSHIIQSRRHNPLSSRKTFRVGVTGPPGAGKSTFIEALGVYLLHQKYRVAVLAIDPSSVRTGGSILGDKTRMSQLSVEVDAFVRPSPTRGTLGGVTRHTADTVTLCEAAGFDIVLVETVGVGQSETAVEGITDMFVLVAPPGGGDELQGIKKGIMELVDVIVVNKADGELEKVAKRAAGEYATALRVMRPKTDFWVPKVKTCSALEGVRVDDVWKVMKEYWDLFESTGRLEERRAQQRKEGMWTLLQEEIMKRFSHDPRVSRKLHELEGKVTSGDITPGAAADQLLDAFFLQLKASQ